METDASKERLEQVKERFGFGGDLEKEKEKMAMTPIRR